MSQTREPKGEQEILQSFQSQRNELRNLAAKIEELASEANEHGLVLKTLEPMEKNRKCFRLIGGVLVERTIADVAPAVKTNKEQLDLLVERLRGQFEGKQQELANFQEKHKIRMKGQPEENERENQESTASHGNSK
ncbi:hypothetical protein WJX84_005486 [Apatococcus fuscideae]|uniref:Prefoldin subunit 2 n=1 Tax=Apatococcus fuscideae TaxID=2026836 RepID=A0AAW1TCH6_9CHLO